MKPRRPPLATAAAGVLAVLLAVACAVHADEVPEHDHEHDHDRARQAREAGEVLPLREILDRLARSQPGQVLDVDLERRQGRWIYAIKLLRAGGTLVRLKVDARDGRVIDAARGEGTPRASEGAR
jgi:uncharacterized membrane protein YkoI